MATPRLAPPRAARAAPPAGTDEVRARVLEVHRRLCAEYGCPIGYFHDLDPLSELVSSLLSHRTKNRDSARAFRQLRAAFPTWAAVRDAPAAEVQAAIRPATWPEQKAPRIQATLAEVSRRLTGTPGEGLGDDALDFLAALPVRAARDWLESITGVGPKTSAAVLSFSRLRLPALPVDSHHHRVAVRLGLIPASVDVGPAHAWLEAQLPGDWDAQQVYDNHEVLMLHGQHVCHWREPECARCVVLDLCPTGQARLGPDAAEPATVTPVDAPPVEAAPVEAAPAGGRPGEEAGDASPDTAPEVSPASVDDDVDLFGAVVARPAAGRTTRRAASTAAKRAGSERGLPAAGPPPRVTQGWRTASDHAEPRPTPQDELPMTVNPKHANPDAPGPDRGDHTFQDARDQNAGQGATPESAASKAHGTHGKGDAREVLEDEVAVDSGDDPQFRRGGAGRDEAPDPAKFAKNSEGRMGGAGWGSEGVGGSSVDRRPDDSGA